MNFTLANSIILAGIIQGFIFGWVYLFSKKYRSKSNTFLALLIIVFSYNNLQFYLSDAQIIGGNTMYATFYIPVGSLIPVFIFKYTVSFLQIGIFLRRRSSYLLYVPFILFFILVIGLKIDSIGDYYAVNKPVWQTIGKVQSIFSLLYTLTLIVVSYWMLRNHTFLNKKEERIYKRESKWLQRMLLFLFILSLLWAIALIKYVSDTEFKVYFTTLWIGLSLAIYWLGHIGIYKYGIREERKQIRAKALKTTAYSITKYSKNSFIIKIERIVIEKENFLDPTFSAERLAEELHLSKSHLSRIFNSEMNVSFSEFINSLRVEKAKKYLQNPEFIDYTLVAIGLEAGFNSKTTFNTTFKKITGQTPSQFRKAASEQ
jgi:AraC-like DNA-binding protein